jgi:hypothetical protein
MRVLIAISLVMCWAAFSVYALWRVAQDLVLVRYAPGSSLSDHDDDDVAPNANRHPPVVQKAKREQE